MEEQIKRAVRNLNISYVFFWVKQEKEEFHKYIIPQNTVDKITILIDYK